MFLFHFRSTKTLWICLAKQDHGPHFATLYNFWPRQQYHPKFAVVPMSQLKTSVTLGNYFMTLKLRLKFSNGMPTSTCCNRNTLTQFKVNKINSCAKQINLLLEKLDLEEFTLFVKWVNFNFWPRFYIMVLWTAFFFISIH